MENFGSEIGQKMRSAVKAKLLELGTGGSAGYIDDELPDYVMIMVANKRSKQQMITDLNLFLGTQTELFVTWLHEVLQKLQEVTLPAANSSSRKRKSSQREDAATNSSSNSKKDKRSYKKDKKLNASKKTLEEPSSRCAVEAPETPTTTTGPSITVPVINSITDVFAEDLLEKAKQSLVANADASLNIKKGKGKKAVAEEDRPPTNATSGIAFDIPTISEISSTTEVTTSGNREQDLAELAEIQKKIYAAKKHLKHLENINEAESEDEDFLNLKDDGSADEFNEAGDLVKKKVSKPKSPIVFCEKDLVRQEKAVEEKEKQQERRDDEQTLPTKRHRLTPLPASSEGVADPCIDAKVAPVAMASRMRDSSPTSASRRHDNVPVRRSRERERREPPSQTEKKRSVHDRLGHKPTLREDGARERRGRQDKELYVPAFRRRERERSKERNNVRERARSGYEKEPEREGGRNSTRRRSSPTSSASTPKKRIPRDSSGGRRSVSPLTQRQRIGSRVIVATTKPPEPSDDEDLINKNVNSVIKIKPRLPVSPSKQACKNLLLRAVAEAQRSTVLRTPKKDAITKVTVRLDDVGEISERSTKLYSKSYRDRLKRKKELVASTPSNLFRRTTQNLLIEVEGGVDVLNTAQLHKRRRRNSKLEEDLEADDTRDSMSEKVESDMDYLYVPHVISNIGADEEDLKINYHLNEVESDIADTSDHLDMEKTQFVVTLNDDKVLANKQRLHVLRSRSNSPLPQVTSSSSLSCNNGVEGSSSCSATHSNSSSKHSSGTRDSRRSDTSKSRRSDIKSRLQQKTSSLSPSTAARLAERDSNSSIASTTPPPPRRSELIEIYHKPKEVKKIIIKNDSEDDEHSPKKSMHNDNKHQKYEKHDKQENRSNKRRSVDMIERNEERSTTPPLPTSNNNNNNSLKQHCRSECSAEKTPKASPSAPSPQPISPPVKRKRTLIKFDLNVDNREKRATKSYERDVSQDRRSGDDYPHSKQRISIRNTEARKYENIPSLSSVAIDSPGIKVNKPKERCKYHPNCTKHNCDFYHPSAPCKSFPNCKYAEKCIYSHPRCKFDMSCTNIDCNFSHSGTRNPNNLQSTAPPLSSHVVPVQNYKSISAAPAASSSMCKYFPNCTKIGCSFYHPKTCRFGKNCINKLECNFYHHELQSSSKFKWVATVV